MRFRDFQDAVFFGGPLDGDVQRCALPAETDVEERRGHHNKAKGLVGTMVYSYRLSEARHRGLLRYDYAGQNWVERNPETGEEGEDMGFKKFGVGEIVETENEQQDMTKTASQGWTDKDQAELDDENQE